MTWWRRYLGCVKTTHSGTFHWARVYNLFWPGRLVALPRGGSPERVKQGAASTKGARILRLQIHSGTSSGVLQDVQSMQALSAGLPLPARACLHQPEGGDGA